MSLYFSIIHFVILKLFIKRNVYGEYTLLGEIILFDICQF